MVVDGSNLATEGRSLPSLAQLEDAVMAYKGEHPDDEIIVVVDASFGYRIDPSEQKRFEEAEEAGEIASPPAGAIGRGDGFLLRIADRIGAVVLSNDSFQEFHGDYGWLFDEGRLVGGKPVPTVGWVFTPRTPVRGPRSRVAVRDAKAKRRAETVETEPVQQAIAEATAEAVAPEGAPSPRKRRRGGKPPEAVNEPLPFITFIAEHPLGSEVEGTVESFTSHGAFVMVEDARCYAPMSGLGDPPPRSAKEVLTRGDTRSFVVQALDPPRRGIELALPGLAQVSGAPTEETVEAEIEAGKPRRSRRRPARVPEGEPAPAGTSSSEPAGAAVPAASATSAEAAAVPEEPVPVARKATRARKSAARKVPAELAEAGTATPGTGGEAGAAPAATKKASRARKGPKTEAVPAASATSAEAAAALEVPAQKAPPAKKATRARKASSLAAVAETPPAPAEAPAKKATRARKAARPTSAPVEEAPQPAATEAAPDEPARKAPAAKKATRARKAATPSVPAAPAAAEEPAGEQAAAKKATKSRKAAGKAGAGRVPQQEEEPAGEQKVPKKAAVRKASSRRKAASEAAVP